MGQPAGRFPPSCVHYKVDHTSPLELGADEDSNRPRHSIDSSCAGRGDSQRRQPGAGKQGPQNKRANQNTDLARHHIVVNHTEHVAPRGRSGRFTVALQDLHAHSEKGAERLEQLFDSALPRKRPCTCAESTLQTLPKLPLREACRAGSAQQAQLHHPAHVPHAAKGCQPVKVKLRAGPP